MKKKSPSANDSARPSQRAHDEVDESDADGAPTVATLLDAPKFDRAKDAASRKVPASTVPHEVAAKTVIGAEVPPEIRDRPSGKPRPDKSAEKPEKADATVLNAPAFVADKPEKAVQDQPTVLKAAALVDEKADKTETTDKVLAAQETMIRAPVVDEASLDGVDGMPTAPIVLEPAVITSPIKAAVPEKTATPAKGTKTATPAKGAVTAPVLPVTPPGKPTAIVEAFNPQKAPLTPEQRAIRIRLILLGAGVVLVIALFIPGLLKARKPSIEALQEAYKSTFRDPHLANPRADMIKFELVKSAPCATHPEDSCLVYDLTGPKYSSQIAVFKGADGWVLERNGVEKQ